MDITIKKGMTASVLGLGRSGMAVIEYLAPRGVSLFAYDDGEVSKHVRERLRTLGVPLFARGEGEIRGDTVFRSPAVRPDAPRLCRAALRGARITSEAELFLSLCPAPVFAVTGSDGKTTTASFLADLLSHTGRRVYLGGNIGRSLLPVLDGMTEKDLCVMELSSFQLAALDASLYTGVVTNLTENHLNWHKSMAEYVGAKRRLITLAERCVLRAGLFPEENAVRFSSLGEGDYFLRDGTLYGRGLALCALADMRLSGRHNAENLLAASAAAEGLVTPAEVKATARRFAGAPHRMEWVGDKDGVHFYNSSIDTTPSRTAVTVRALSERGHKLLLLCGGREKGLALDILADTVKESGARVYLFGEAEERIAAALRERGISYTASGSMERAILDAYRDAREGDTVLLSPACTSFDAFADFEARGEAFRFAVGKLKKK